MDSSTTSGDLYYEYTNTDLYQYYNGSNDNSNPETEEDYEMEDDYYNEYDAQMVHVMTEADYEDYYNSCQDSDYNEEDNQIDDSSYESQANKDSYDYRTDSLLSLVVGVQNYLSEQANSTSKCDSPLYSLQYKMYTYMRQRAFELGAQF